MMEHEEAPFQEPKINDLQIISYIWAVVERYRSRQEQESLECILCQEKLLQVALMLLEKDPDIKLPFDIKDEVTSVVQKINKLAMENIRDSTEGGSSRFISKAVDLIMMPSVATHFSPSASLLKLRILTFNNLACVLKSSRHFMMALKAVSYAVEMEEQLVGQGAGEGQYDIVATYLNKAAILSEMGKHGKALQEIRKARTFAERIERQVQGQLRECSQGELRGRLQEKRHYGSYMKMLISYSIGVQKQHQKLISSAISYYTQGKRLALAIDNQLMATKLEDIILKLKKE